MKRGRGAVRRKNWRGKMGFLEVLKKVKGNVKNGSGSISISIRKGKVRG